MKIHRTISFIVDKEKDSPSGKLRMRVRWGSDNRVAVNLGYRITLAKWSTESQRCKANTLHGKDLTPASDINAEIQRYEQVANAVFEDYERSDREPSAQEYRETLRAELGKKSAKGDAFYPIWNEYLNEASQGHCWSKGTMDTRITFGKLIHREYPDIGITEMFTPEWIREYKSELVENGKKNITIHIYISNIVSFYHWAVRKKYASPGLMEQVDLKLKLVPRAVVWLNWEEVTKMYNAKLPESLTKNYGAIEDARIVFCFSCFTGLRRSDIANLKWSMVSNDSLTVVTQKTATPIRIELNDYSRAIIERQRKNRSEIFPEYVFPVFKTYAYYSIQSGIKIICKHLGFSEPVTMTYYVGGERRQEIRPKYELLSLHCGRRTFICNALEMDISPQVIMRWTGHKKYESMKPYIDISDKAKSEAMAKFNKK